jgi:hypothetical protein
MLRTRIRRVTGTVAASLALTHSLGTTADFVFITRYGGAGAFRPGQRTRLTSMTGANTVRAINTVLLNCTIDVVCGVYQGRLF